MAIEQNAKRGGLLPRRRRPAPVDPGSTPELGTVPAQHIDSVVAALTAPEPYTPEMASPPEEEKTPLGRMVTPDLPAQLSAGALDEAEAEAGRLRAQLDEIRQLLDGTPPTSVPPAPPTGPGRGRRRFLKAAVVLLAACAVGGGVAAVVVTNQAKDDARPVTGTPTAGSRPTQSPAGLPATGAGVDAPGTALGVQLLTDRSIAVTEQALLPAGTSSSVVFTLHRPAPGDLTGDAATLRPGVSDVRATVDGALVPVTQDGERWTVDTSGTGERRVVLSYRLTAAVGASQPSEAGRALGLVLPLTTEALDGQGVSVQVPADGVRNVVCAGASTDQALCAARTGTGWQADVPREADSPAVLLQLDL